MAKSLSDKERTLMDAYWRASNYLSVGEIYLYDNPLLKQPLTKEHIKPRCERLPGGRANDEIPSLVYEAFVHSRHRWNLARSQ